MTEPITVGLGNNKWLKTADVQGLAFSDTYTNTGTSTVYTVPAGKVFTILNCTMSAASDWLNVRAYIQANGIKIAAITAAGGEGNGNAFSMNTIKTITAGQTLQFYRQSVDGRSTVAMSVAGVETNA